MRKLIRYLVIAVLVLWVVKDPSGAAHLAHQSMAALAAAAHSLSAVAAGL